MSELSKKKIIGITGSMGAGKSQVSHFIQKEYPVLDCDRVNRQLLEPGQEGYAALVHLPLVPLLADGQINKPKLAQMMFSDAALKRQIEDILHPLILKKMQEWIRVQTSALVFVEVPLLFENHLEPYFDSIWCVVTSEEVALQRLQDYRNMSREHAKKRLVYQMDPKKKMHRSTLVLKNEGSLSELKNQVKQAIEKEACYVDSLSD